MATDLRLAYADIDEALFDVNQIPMTSRDVRSVGEMLFDVDYLARQLLMDVDGDAAGTLLRSWPTMVAAAEDLWASLPGRRPGVDERDRPITSLSAQAATIETSLSGRTAWPGQGPTSPRIDQMTQTFINAAALVRRYGAEIPHEQPDAHRDLEAARTRIMHGLYLTAHAVNVALHEHGRDRVNDARSAGRRIHLAQHHSPYAIAPTGVWVDRMSACENTARSYLTDRFTQALAGEAVRPVDDPSRLAQALANWDIQTHRALARDLELSNILLITRTQGLIAGASIVLVDAAATAGVLERSERLVPAIAEAGRSWSNLASRWGDLAPPGARLEEPLARAAAEVRAAYRQITHDKTTLATPDVIAKRPGLPQAVPATLRAIEAGPSSRSSSPRRPTHPTSSGRPGPCPAGRTTTSRPAWQRRQRSAATSSGSLRPTSSRNDWSLSRRQSRRRCAKPVGPTLPPRSPLPRSRRCTVWEEERHLSVRVSAWVTRSESPTRCPARSLLVPLVKVSSACCGT